jgi:hypothetical protein
VREFIKLDIEKKQTEMEEDISDTEIMVQNDEIYDIDAFKVFKTEIQTIFDTYSVPVDGEKCVDINDLLRLKNPEVRRAVDRLNWLCEDLNFEGNKGRYRIT